MTRWMLGPFGTVRWMSVCSPRAAAGWPPRSKLDAQVDDSGLPTLVANRLQHQIGARQPVTPPPPPVREGGRRPGEEGLGVVRAYSPLRWLQGGVILFIRA